MFKKINVLLSFLFLLGSALQAQIEFEKGNWPEVLAKAKTQKKYIFVDAFTTWCGPCTWMSKNVFTDKEVGEYYNKNFINFKLNMEEGEGPQFAQKYNVTAYPTLIYFDPTGEPVHKIVSAKPSDAFISDGKDALNPEKQVFSLKKKYDKGEKKPELLRNYAFALRGAYEEYGQVVQEYLSTQPEQSWVEASNWEFIETFVNQTNSKAFLYVVANQSKFEKSFGAEKVQQFISTAIWNEAMPAFDNGNEIQMKEALTKFDKFLPSLAEKNKAKMQAYFYGADKEKSFPFDCIYFDKYCDNAEELTGIVWNYLEQTQDKVKLNKTLSWIDKSIQMQKSASNLHTKAELLHRLGRKQEALKFAQESLAISKPNNEDITQYTEELIQRINNGKE